jgi:hypothetical protein
MSKVLIPNIIITRDYDAMTAIFSGDKYIDSSKLKSDNKLFFLSANKNKYLTSFEYDLTFKTDKESFFKINFIDSDGNFESEFLESSFLSKFLTTVTNKISNIRDLTNTLTGEKTVVSNLYIAFGIGEDLANWSDPHACQFRMAEIQIDANGRRIYSFHFFPTNEPIFRRQFAYNLNSINYENEFSFLNELEYKLNVSYDSKDYKKVSENIRNLLKNYLSSVCNTKNIVILLPNIDKAFEKDNPLRRDLETPGLDPSLRAYYIYDGIVEKYAQLLGIKVITAIKPGDDLPLKLKYQRSKANVQLEAEYADVVNKLNIESAKESEANINYLAEKPNSPEQARAYAILQQIRKNVDNLDKARLKLEDKIKTSNPGFNPLDGVSKILSTYQSTTDYLKEATQKLNEDLKSATEQKFTLFFDDQKSRKSTTTPNTFDWYQCLNKVFAGIAKVAELSQEDSAPYLYEETNMNMIKLWYENGIIPDKTSRCVVLGVKTLVNNYLYRNSAYFDKGMTFESTIEFKPVYELEDQDLKKKLTSSNYPKQLFNLLSKKKTSSAFSEQVILDELAVDPSKTNSKPFLKFLSNSNLLKLSNTPIFLNNLKNSNIRSIDVKNLDSYFAAINFNVKSDFVDDLLLRAKAVFPTTTLSKKINKNLDEIIKIVVKKTIEKKKEQENQINSQTSYSPLSPTTVPKLTTAAQDIFKEISNTFYADLNNQQALKNYTKLYDKIKETLYTKQDYSLIFSLLSQEISNVDSFKNSEVDDTVISDIEALSLFIEALFTLGLNNSPTLTISGKNGLPVEKNVKAALFQYLYTTTAPTVTIRTLPFFHLSNVNTVIGKTCILISKRTVSQVSPINSQLENMDNNLDFFSGVYNIVGAKHVITTSDCYSEFVMLKLKGETIN